MPLFFRKQTRAVCSAHLSFCEKRKPITICSHKHAILHVIYGCIDNLLFEYHGEALQIAVFSESLLFGRVIIFVYLI